MSRDVTKGKFVRDRSGSVTRRVSRLSAAASAIGLAIAFFGAAGPAFADGDGGDYDRLIEFWTTYGVPAETQDALIQGLKHGDLPDSVTEGEVPISTATTAVAGETVTVATYADGSVSTTTIEAPAMANGGPSPMAVNGCTLDTYTGVTYYTNCRVSGDNGIVVLGFYANFTISHYGLDAINGSGWGAVVECFPGTCGTPYMNGYNPNETSAQRAFLIYSVQYNAGSAGTTTRSVTLLVGRNSYSSNFS